MTWRSALTLLCILLLVVVFTAVVRTILDPGDPLAPSGPIAPDDRANGGMNGRPPVPSDPPERPGTESGSREAPPPTEDEEDPDGSAAADPKTPSTPEEKRLPDGYHPKLTGSITDVSSGEPVVGASVRYGPLPGSWGAVADGEGEFELRVASHNLNPDRPFRVRILAPGYEPFEIMPREAKLSIELVPRTGPVVLGRIQGRIEDKDGLPVRGVVGVTVGTPDTMTHWLRAFANENGAFVLEAVDPGGCTIKALRGDAVNAFVPEGGKVHVVIRSAEAREKLEALTTTGMTSADRHRLEAATQRLVQIRKQERAARESGSSEEALQQLQSQGQQAAEKIRAFKRRQEAGNRREVLVTDIPGPDGARLVVESVDNATIERWWAVVRKGTATLPALYPTVWKVTLKAETGDTGGEVELSKDATRLKFPSTGK